MLIVLTWSSSISSQTSWGSRADADTNDDIRMSPRPKRSDSITTPPGRDLPRYIDVKAGYEPGESIRDRGEKQHLFENIDKRIAVPAAY